MAFAHLNDSTAIWTNLGLNYLLMPYDVLDKPLPAAPRKSEPIPQRSVSNYKKSQAPVSSAKAPVETRQRIWRKIPVEQWPTLWQQRLNNAKKAKIAWTYWNLGKDLLRNKSGPIDPDQKKRSQFLGFLLKSLNHPVGTHTFWPLGLPQDGDPQNEIIANPDLFWSGVMELGCRGAIIMGAQEARTVLAKQDVRPLMQYRYRGFLAWVLWDVDVMTGRTDAQERAIEYLRNATRIIARR